MHSFIHYNDQVQRIKKIHQTIYNMQDTPPLDNISLTLSNNNKLVSIRHTEESISHEAATAAAAAAAAPSATNNLPFESLPNGWVEAVDPSSGMTFYYNRETRQSSWERPLIHTNDAAMEGASAGAEENGEPGEEEEEETANDGEPPEDPTAEERAEGTVKNDYDVRTNLLDEAISDEETGASTANDLSLLGSLPRGWREAVDSESGNTFYYNLGNGASS